MSISERAMSSVGTGEESDNQNISPPALIHRNNVCIETEAITGSCEGFAKAFRAPAGVQCSAEYHRSMKSSSSQLKTGFHDEDIGCTVRHPSVSLEETVRSTRGSLQTTNGSRLCIKNISPLSLSSCFLPISHPSGQTVGTSAKCIIEVAVISGGSFIAVLLLLSFNNRTSTITTVTLST